LRIDVHAHYFPVEYLDRLDRYGGTQLTLNIRKNRLASPDLHHVDALLRAMDGAELDMQVLSVSSQFPYFANEADAADAARFGNELYADIVAKYPQRFAAFASTPLPHVDASIAEISHALDQLGMAGITAGTTVMGKSITDSAFDSFFAELNRRKAVLFIHPTGGNAGSSLIEATKLTWPIGAPLEDTICMLQLMQADVPRRFPDAKIILPHLGGFAPFLTARLDQLRAHFLPESAALPSAQANYFWYDTVNAHPPALRCTQETVGTDRLLLGSDYPFWRDEAFKLSVDYVRKAGLSENDESSILGGNAQRLLGINL